MYRILHTLWTTIVIILSPLILFVSVMASDAPNSKGLPTLIILGVSLVIIFLGFYLIDKLPKKECSLECETAVLMGENIPERALANIIDIFITNALYAMFPLYKLGLGLIGGTMFFFCYFWLFEKFFSATPGKMILGLKVIMETGKACSNKSVFIRCIVKTFDVYTLFLLSIINIFRTPNRQSIGDYFAKTLVIYKRKAVKF